MEAYESLLIIILVVGSIISIALSVIYYFARYSVKTDHDRDLEAVSAKPEVAKASINDLTAALNPTRQNFWGRISGAFTTAKVPSEILDQIEEILFTSDLGGATVHRLLQKIEHNLRGSQVASIDQVRNSLREEMLSIFASLPKSELKQPQATHKPTVWLIVGVNGAGKTTTIGKLAAAQAQAGRKVLVAAGDTFRAAAGEQLKIWSDRARVEIFSPPNVTDPAAVAYEACQKGKLGGFDLVLIDTAGRLHTQKNLMEELRKVKRVMAKVLPTAPDETLLVLDANSGQNALQQAREFHSALNVSGVVLTKMDGTAKGGVALGIASELQLPVRLIGIGERVADLQPFNAEEYVSAIL